MTETFESFRIDDVDELAGVDGVFHDPSKVGDGVRTGGAGLQSDLPHPCLVVVHHKRGSPYGVFDVLHSVSNRSNFRGQVQAHPVNV